MSHFRHVVVAAVGGAMLTAAFAFDAPARAAGPKSSPARPPIQIASRPGPPNQVLQVPGQEGAVPHRARQRLHRQYLAHPDDPDRQGLCGPAGRRGQAEGIQGRVDRRGRAAQISAINNFINSGYDAIVVNAQNPTAFAPGHQARQGSRRHPRRLRQHSRHPGRDQRQRRPEGPRRALGQLADRACARTAARSSKCAASPAPRSTPTATTASTRPSTPPARSGTWSKWSASGMIRRAQKATADAIAVQRSVRRHHRAGRRYRRRAGDDRRQAAVRAVRRRDRERLPQVLRRSMRPTA